MPKYKCFNCGYIYDDDREDEKFEDLPDSWVCPMCLSSKNKLKELDKIEAKFKEIKVFKKAITVLESNESIEKIDDKCIDCGLCTMVCKKREGINNLKDGKACVHCGQCIQICPTGALVPKNDMMQFNEAKNNKKICIAYIAPSVRVAIGDAFEIDKGKFLQGKLITALRKIGFDYVFDVTFGADLTIMEEANELVRRIKNGKNLPMFTSCCPAWVKYAEQYYPDILNHLSTCKSPIAMQGSIVQEYFTNKMHINKDDIFTVAIAPCTAKKSEVLDKSMSGTDAVFTTAELVKIIKNNDIDFLNLEDSEFDSLLGEGSGAGMIFGNTGGVMEAALRTTFNILTGEDPKDKYLEFNDVRGLQNVKECTLDINGLKLNVAVINQMSSAIPILEEVRKGNSKYQFIEIMNCLGGCIGGGGQPKVPIPKEYEVKQNRINSLYNRDKKDKIRFSYRNPNIISVYNEYLNKPLSRKAEKVLHRMFEDKSYLIK